VSAKGKAIDRAVTLGVPAAVVAVVAVGAYLLYKIARPVGGALEAGGDAAKNLLDAVASVTEGTAALGSAAGSTAGAAAELLNPLPYDGHVTLQVPYDGTKPALVIRRLKADRNWTSWGQKYTEVTMEAVDKATGKRVPGVTFYIEPMFELYRLLHSQKYQAQDGWIRYVHKVANIAGTDQEDDFYVWATAPGYNRSDRVGVK
jgi:hypothetical protein